MVKKSKVALILISLLFSSVSWSQEQNPCLKSEEGMAVVVFNKDAQPHKIQIRTCESVAENNQVQLKPVGALSAMQLKNFLETRQPGNHLWKCFGTLGNADHKDGVLANINKFIESQRSINLAYGAGYKYFDPLLTIESDLNLPSTTYKADGTTNGSIKSDAVKANQDVSRIKCAQKIAEQYNDSFTNADLIYVPLHKVLSGERKTGSQ